MTIVLAPAYQPGAHLLTLVDDLRDAAPDAHVVVVDDGSAPAAAAPCCAMTVTAGRAWP
jgi:hypothetical protein